MPAHHLMMMLLSEQTIRGTLMDLETTDRLILQRNALHPEMDHIQPCSDKITRLSEAMSAWDASSHNWFDTDDASDDLVHSLQFIKDDRTISQIAMHRSSIALLQQLEASARTDLEAFWFVEWELLEGSHTLQQLREAEPRYDFASGCVQVQRGRPGTGRVVGRVHSNQPQQLAAQRRPVAWTPQQLMHDRSESASSGRVSKEPPPWW